MARRGDSWFRRVLQVGVGVVALGGGGCADNNASFFIRGVLAPTPAGTVCNYTATAGGMRITEGTLDVSLAERYFMAPLLQSALIARQDPTAARLETNAIQVQGFIVEIHRDEPTGPLLVPQFSVYQGSYLEAALGGVPMVGYALVEVIPRSFGQVLRQQVCAIAAEPSRNAAVCPVPRFVSNDQRLLVRLRAFGTTNGNVSVETPFFDFPINVCCHCLVQFPTEADSIEMATTAGGTARRIPDCNNGTAVLSQGTCSPGQDFPLDCRFCAGSNPAICQPRGFSLDPSVTCPSN